MEIFPGGHAPSRMPAPQRCPHCLRLLVSQAYQDEERCVREGDKVREGSPHSAPGIWPHALRPGRGQRRPSLPLPSPGSCGGNLYPPGEPSLQVSPDRLLSSSEQPLPLSASLHFPAALRLLSGTPAHTLGLHPLSAGALADSSG